MSYMIAGSEPTIMTESQLFYVPPTITERMSTYDVLIGPSAATFDEANDISFDIAPGNDLISLADMRFQCDLQVMSHDGKRFVEEDMGCPCNNVLSTLFQCVQVTLAGRSISDPPTFTSFARIWKTSSGMKERPKEANSLVSDSD